jgi:hypothetical protein
MGRRAYRAPIFKDNLDAIAHVLCRLDDKGVDLETHRTSKAFLLMWAFGEITRLRWEVEMLSGLKPPSPCPSLSPLADLPESASE